MSQPTVLITGANRGIGAGYVQAFLDIGYKVIAAVRTPSSIEPREGVVVVKIDSESKTDPKEAAQELREKYGIERIDIIIANAGYYAEDKGLDTLDPEDAEKGLRINVIGPILLAQAFKPFLPRPEGKFVIVGSRAGVLGITKGTGGSAAYGLSKTGSHYVMRKLHFENPDLIIFCILPGHLVTDMGNQSARNLGLANPPRQLSDTLPGMMKVITTATREENGGELMEWDGTKSVW